MVWLLFAAWTPPALHRWRILLLRVFGAEVAWSAFVYGSARIWYPANLVMAAGATLGPGTICYSMAPIRIGSKAVVSQRAHLCCGTHDIHGPQFQIQARSISIGDYAWICAEAFVGPGVQVGEGAVLAARAVSFRDIDSWQVHRGNPAVLIGNRERHTQAKDKSIQ